MPRVISFIVLLAIVLLVGAVSFQVMAQFMVPMFLACVLLVVFEPLHRRIVEQIPRWPRLAAMLTTILIVLSVVLPLIGLGWKAYDDFHALLDRPAAASVAESDRQEAVAPSASDPREGASATAPSDIAVAGPESRKEEEVELSERLKDFVNGMLKGIGLTWWSMDAATAARVVAWATSFAGSFVITGVKSAIGVLFGLLIMVISLYYFLVDGPAMINTLMRLSPLEERYERELLARFGQVSRAVVVATLLSAVMQGALAGIGYFFALPLTAPIFLLTALTIVTAMIPFFGAAAVWIFVCLWVFVYGEATTAVVLAIYCTVIVSGIDNIIKPLVLHGQSNLHPLLALLSILGGVTVLGPVGIIVGPMLVSFLQALLDMLRKELDSFSDADSSAAKQLAAIVDAAASGSVEGPAAEAAEGAVDPKALAATSEPRGKTAPAAPPLRGRRVPPRKRGR